MLHNNTHESDHASWSLSQWLHQLEHRHTEAIQLGLERVSAVAKRLNLLHPSSKVMLIAGTNGKGSTVAVLERIYRLAGYRVGAYTSPHLLAFNERIVYNGEPISDEALVDCFCRIEMARGDTHLTYFETATLAALLYFNDKAVDIMFLEVGMGGRLDATNILDADVSMITTVDYDHQAYLGDTLEAIGREKAGIFKPQKPCIYGDDSPPHTVTAQAAALACPYYRIGEHYHLETQDGQSVYRFEDTEITYPASSIHPHCIAIALTAICLLQRVLPVSSNVMREGIEHTRIQGRFQRVLTEGGEVIIDVSHNEQAVSHLKKRLEREAPHRTIHAVFAGFKDKPLAKMIALLKPLVAHWYPAFIPGPRGIDAKALMALFQGHGISLQTCHNSPFSAYQAAINHRAQGDLVLVFGSFITAGEVLHALQNKESS